MLGLGPFLVCLLVACTYALWRGGAPERIVATMFLSAWAASFLLDQPFAARFVTVAPGIATVDVLLLAGLLAVALTANRYWPMAVVSLQVIMLLAHLLKAMDTHMIRAAYSVLLNLPVYPQLLLLALGTLRHRRRLARTGADASWSNSFAMLHRNRLRRSPLG